MRIEFDSADQKALVEWSGRIYPLLLEVADIALLLGDAFFGKPSLPLGVLGHEGSALLAHRPTCGAD